MRKHVLVLFVCSLIGRLSFALIPNDERIMDRGDANSSGGVNMSDASYINNWLFSGGPEPPCMNQADANNDGRVDISDSVFLLNWLFNGGPAPPSPGPYNSSCAQDDSPYPGCQTDPC